MPKVQAAETTNGRGRRGPRVVTSLAEINVVPLVDVTLVLLIIFMVTAPMMQRGIDVKLPVARRSQQLAEERMFVTVPLSYRQDKRVLIGDESIPAAVLTERLRQQMLNRTDRQVFLRGDGAVTLQELMEILDQLKAAGVENVGIVSRLPGER